jgi:hypothetical protein
MKIKSSNFCKMDSCLMPMYSQKFHFGGKQMCIVIIRNSKLIHETRLGVKDNEQMRLVLLIHEGISAQQMSFVFKN